MKFRKKPVVIEAVLFDGVEFGEYSNFVPGEIHHFRRLLASDGTALDIRTLEGWVTASPGDWIIKGVAGEFYPCKPDIFAVTYEQVADAELLTGPNGGQLARAQPSGDPTRILG